LAPDAAVGRLSQRLGIAMGELRGYGEREQTRTGHLREVAGYAGWRSVDTGEWKDLDEFLFARAMEHDSPKLLFRLACEYLLSSRVIRPGVILLLRRVAAARARTRTETWARVKHLLSDRWCAELDLLLVPDAYLGRTRMYCRFSRYRDSMHRVIALSGGRSCATVNVCLARTSRSVRAPAPCSVTIPVPVVRNEEERCPECLTRSRSWKPTRTTSTQEISNR
jgi:hypothetical protein